MILAEITNFMSMQLLSLRPSLNKWSDAIKSPSYMMNDKNYAH